VEQIALANLRKAAPIFLVKILLLALLPVLMSHPARAAEEYEVKAAFLLNFTKFVAWPPDAFADAHSPLSICVLGDDPFRDALNEIVKGEAVSGHALTVQRIHGAPESKACQVLYFATSEHEAGRILAGLSPGVLTVGEGDKFLRDGGMIAFFIQDRRVRFDISQGAAARARLMLSSRLMMVARSIVK
jgi:YfiR/HmsC-like